MGWGQFQSLPEVVQDPYQHNSTSTKCANGRRASNFFLHSRQKSGICSGMQNNTAAKLADLLTPEERTLLNAGKLAIDDPTPPMHQGDLAKGFAPPIFGNRKQRRAFASKNAGQLLRKVQLLEIQNRGLRTRLEQAEGVIDILGAQLRQAEAP